MFCLSWKRLKNNFFSTNPKNLTLFKNGITVPGLTLKYLFSTVKSGIHFTIIDSQNQDLHQMIEHNITGVPSIIFCRYQAAGVTKIGELEYGSEAKLCHSILGKDANELYLWVIMQEMPTSYFIHYKESNNFKPMSFYTNGYLTREWLLEWVSSSENMKISHMCNGKEKGLDPEIWMLIDIAQKTRLSTNCMVATGMDTSVIFIKI